MGLRGTQSSANFDWTGQMPWHFRRHICLLRPENFLHIKELVDTKLRCKPSEIIELDSDKDVNLAGWRTRGWLRNREFHTRPEPGTVLAGMGHQTGRNTLTAYFLRRIFVTLRPYTYVNIDQGGGNGTGPIYTRKTKGWSLRRCLGDAHGDCLDVEIETHDRIAIEEMAAGEGGGHGALQADDRAGAGLTATTRWRGSGHGKEEAAQRRNKAVVWWRGVQRKEKASAREGEMSVADTIMVVKCRLPLL
ncbi:hypothetical protein DFH08DRAFT_826508 [Mycena albidolilacea]|uniref:Uncharacterized protein n=1 Tax=Mycena albidolilacea TaxID=1033008 RepID=A0AAD7E964_9AGAR|nr:hypothetical protein DFH08DRAFT_826508 [Mycena albidolilacea]